MYDYLKTTPGERGDPEYGELTPQLIKKLFSDCSDFEKRDIYFGLDAQLTLNLFWLDGLTDGTSISEDIIRPLSDALRTASVVTPSDCLDFVLHGLAYSSNAKHRIKTADVVSDLVNGFCAVLIPGAGAVCFEVKSQNVRSISEPSLEKSVKGGKDAFVETVRTNTALVRRRIRDPRLKTVKTVLGRRSHTVVELLYLDEVIDPALPKEILSRLNSIDVDSVLATGIVEEVLSDSPLSPLPQVIHTERPDRLAMYLSEGRVGILIDGIPIALVAPVTFAEFMKVTGDSNMHFAFSSLLSVMRYLALIVSVFVPAIYVAVAMYHQEMIPTRLLLSIINAKQDVPFSTGIEVFGMLIALELLQEAGLRLPNPIGDTVSIIGALIVGQSAVEAKIASPIAIIVVAVSAIACYTLPSQDLGAAVRMLRFALLIGAVAAGLFGIGLLSCLLFIFLADMDSFGRNYTSPLTDGRPNGLMRMLLRIPKRKDKFRDPELRPRDGRRQA